MKKTFFLFFTIFTVAIAQAQTVSDTSKVNVKSSAIAFKEGWGVGVNLFGSYGYGVKLSKQVKKKLSVSIDVNTFLIKDIDVSNLLSDAKPQKLVSKVDLTLGKGSLTADYHLSPRFSLFGGVAFNLMKTSLNINYLDTVVISKIAPGKEIDPNKDVYYSPEDIGEVNVELKPIAVSPFLGIGFGRAVPNKKIGCKFDLGVAYNGSPTISTITATGQMSSIAKDENKQKIENAFSSYKYYPFLNFSINYKIN